MPLFSVIIPVFNRAELLRETLASLAAQQFTDFEIIVVDDGSSDGSADVARQSGANVHVFEQTNRGPGAARNLAIRHATREYLAFLDSDDVWFPWTLRTYAHVINETASPSFIAGKPLRFHDTRELRSAQYQP